MLKSVRYQLLKKFRVSTGLSVTSMAEENANWQVLTEGYDLGIPAIIPGDSGHLHKLRSVISV